MCSKSAQLQYGPSDDSSYKDRQTDYDPSYSGGYKALHGNYCLMRVSVRGNLNSTKGQSKRACRIQHLTAPGSELPLGANSRHQRSTFKVSALSAWAGGHACSHLYCSCWYNHRYWVVDLTVPVSFPYVSHISYVPFEEALFIHSFILYITGNWKGAAKIPKGSLEDADKTAWGEEKILLSNFMRKILKWKPKERCIAKELLDDRWPLGWTNMQ
jgi:hypothetical protein